MRRLFLALVALAFTIGAFGDALPACNPAAWRPRERWRGFNLEGKAIKGRFSGEWRESDLAMMHELEFNFARIMIDHRYWCKDGDWTQPDPAKFGPIDEVIAWGKKHQIHIQICFSFPPGIDVVTKSKKALFTDPVAHRALATHWAYFARRYKGIPNDELSFNLFNEPEQNGTEENYAPLIRDTTAAIHAEDPARFVVIDGLEWGRNPELAAIQMPVGQSHHAYVPMTVTSYKASWISGAKDWDVPIWPPYPVSGPIFGARKPATHRAPIVIRDVPACELTLRTGVFNREVELIVEADGKALFARHYVPSPKESCWTNLVLRPGGSSRAPSRTLPSSTSASFDAPLRMPDADKSSASPASARSLASTSPSAGSGPWMPITYSLAEPRSVALESPLDRRMPSSSSAGTAFATASPAAMPYMPLSSLSMSRYTNSASAGPGAALWRTTPASAALKASICACAHCLAYLVTSALSFMRSTSDSRR